MKELITKASTKLRRSRTGTLYGDFSNNRISEQSWVHEGESQAAKSITHRIDNFLDLSARTSVDGESFQVANYGLSGQNMSHYDQFLMDPQIEGYSMAKRTVFNVEKGDRLATVSNRRKQFKEQCHVIN